MKSVLWVWGCGHARASGASYEVLAHWVEAGFDFAVDSKSLVPGLRCSLSGEINFVF
jgi:hypothetical protein